MAKVALLIGVSDYGSGLASLPGTQTDIQEMQRVLQNSNVGSFDAVDLLTNPDPTQMQCEIEKLFIENRSKGDLILLYFSGHGVRDDNGTLYFATSITEKNQQGRIRTSTAVPASSLHYYMSQSRSKRQVLILDCCFSGAFANDMKAKHADEAVDVKSLGGEGRAILTSSTATQVSYEKDGASIYTRYLVQGLETGAADRDNNGQITIDELHEYAREKVQEAAPTMQPEIYAVREGYKILIARAPQGDPKLFYRRDIQGRAKEKRGILSSVDQLALEFRWQELGLSSQEAEQIAKEVLQPYKTFESKLKKFEQAIEVMLDNDPQISAASLDDLQYLQRVLKLRDEDTVPILNKYRIYPTSPEPTPSVSTTSSKTTSADSSLNLDDFSSEKGIDYTKLRDQLKAGNWKEADQETYRVMLQSIGREEGDWIRAEQLSKFPCTILCTINELWVKHSNGKFGFQVQQRAWCKFGGQHGKQYSAAFREFGNHVGWRQNDKWLSSFDDFTFSLEAPEGHLPSCRYGGTGWDCWVGSLRSFFPCVETCLQEKHIESTV